MIATDNLPDIVVLDSVTNPIRQQLEKNDRVWDLDTLIEKYAPDMKIPESMHTWYEYEDGKLYGYPSFYGAPEDLEAYPDRVKLEYHNKLIVREDLCQRLGINVEDFSTPGRVYCRAEKGKGGQLNCQRQCAGTGIFLYPASSAADRAAVWDDLGR